MPVIAEKPRCRHCNAVVRPFGRCPNCGRRAWIWTRLRFGPGRR